MNKKIKDIDGLYFFNGKIAQFLSEYENFNKLTSLKTILVELKENM
jgi:hypothetical protein